MNNRAMDMSSIDARFTSFVSQMSANKSVLCVSSTQNLGTSNVKDITACANEYIDSMFHTKDLHQSMETALNAFTCLYYACRDTSSLLSVVRKHQTSVVKMISLKLYDKAITHLQSVQQAIISTVTSSSFAYVQSTTSGSLMVGVPFQSGCSEEISKLVVAFHFLSLQAVLKLFSQNLKLLVKDKSFKHPLISTDVIRDLPYVFLSSSNFMRWISHQANPSTTQKHVKNILTMLEGLIALCERVPSSPAFNSRQTRSQFLVKLWEFKYRESGEVQVDLCELAQDSRTIEPFYKELKEAAGEHVPDLHRGVSLVLPELDTHQVVEQLESNPELVFRLKTYTMSPKSSSWINTQSFIRTSTRVLQHLGSQYAEVLILTILKNFAAHKKQLKVLTKDHYHLLDSIISHLKSTLERRSSPEFIRDSVSYLFRILSIFGETKRIRNLVAILYNQSKQTVSPTFDCRCLVLAAHMEFHVCDSDDPKEANILLHKVEKIAKTLLDQRDFSETMDLILELLDCLNPNMLSYQAHTEYNLKTTTKLLLGVLIERPEFAHTLGTKGSSWTDAFKANLLVSCIKEADGSSNIRNALASLLDHLTVEDTTLQAVCTYHAYMVEGLEDHIHFEVSESTDPLVVLLSCGISVLMNINVEWSMGNIEEAIKLFTEYLSHGQPIEHYESEILVMLVQYLSYNGLHAHTKGLLDIYFKERCSNNDSIATKLNFDLMSIYGDACVKLGLSDEVSVSLLTNKSSLKSLFAQNLCSCKDMLEYKILQAQYFIMNGRFDDATKQLHDTIQFAGTKSEFSLSKSKLPISKHEKLCNLLSVSKLHLVTCELQFKTNSHLQCYNNGRTGLKLALSILKSLEAEAGVATTTYCFLWQAVLTATELLKFIIDSSKHLGVSRDIEYFMAELVRLNDSHTFPLRNASNHLYLAGVYSTLHRFDATRRELLKGTSISQLNISSFLEFLALNGKLLCGITSGDMTPESAKELISELRRSEWKTNAHVQILSETSLNLLAISNIVVDLGIPKPLLVTTKKKIQTLLKMLTDVPKFSDLQNSIVTTRPFVSNTVDTPASDKSLEELFTQLVDLRSCLFEFLDENPSAPFVELREAFNQVATIESVLGSFGCQPSESNQQRLYYFEDYLRSLTSRNDSLIKEMTNQTKDSILPQLDNEENVLHDADGFMNRIHSDLPPSWTVITLDVAPDAETMVVSKFNKNVTNPVTVRLPMTRMSKLDDKVPSMDLKRALKELKDIISASNRSILPTSTAQIKTKEDRKKWWSLRFSLDLRIKELLETIEHTWFGCFAGLFNTQPVDVQFVNRFHDVVHQIIPGSANVEFDRQVVEVLLQMPFCFSDDAKFLSDPIEDTIYFIADSLIYAGHNISYDELNLERLSHELTELITDVRASKQSEHLDDHIVLIPGSSCSEIPWESLPSLRLSSVSRLPSIHQLLDIIQKMPTPKPNLSGLYLINPSGDLKNTESRFSPVFSNLANWQGVIGTRPTDPVEFLLNLLEKDLFVYIGHGGCEEYIKPSLFFKHCRNNLPPSLLIGCSSGSLATYGVLGAHGNAYNWLNCGSPMVIANLWDVTDRDIDKFTMHLFDRSSLLHQPSNGVASDFGVCVKEGRDSCNLKYLNGSAPIIYGVPLLL